MYLLLAISQQIWHLWTSNHFQMHSRMQYHTAQHSSNDGFIAPLQAIQRLTVVVMQHYCTHFCSHLGCIFFWPYLNKYGTYGPQTTFKCILRCSTIQHSTVAMMASLHHCKPYKDLLW